MGYPTYPSIDRLPGYDAWKLASPEDYRDHDEDCECEDCEGRDPECEGGCGPRCACAYDMRDKMEDER